MSHLHNQPNDQNDPLDTVLLAEFNSAEQIRASSGFTLSVMNAVHEHATAPPPIPFPWKRILPGAIAILCSFVTFAIWAALHSGPAITSGSEFTTLPVSTSVDATLGWIALALVLTLVIVSMSFRLANGRQR